MAIKFQYNKIYLQLLRKELRVRENALPTLQAKESALRLEVKKAKTAVGEIERRLEQAMTRLAETHRLWEEFPGGLLKITDVKVDLYRIAGVKTPVFRGAEFSVAPFSLFLNPSWIPSGLEMLKMVAALRVEREVARKKVEILEYARKKTTQKVNLYEKVQIPQYLEALRKIKGFLEDEENLSKSSQKILKTKMAAAEASA